MSELSLKHKTVKGVGWSAIDNISNLGVTFVVGIVLARLLGPNDYGLIGVLTIFINVFNSLIDSGLNNALIRKKNVTEIDYTTVFYTNMGISIVLAVLFFFLSYPIAKFFNNLELVNLTKAMSVILIFNALSFVQRTRLTKELNFRTQTVITLISSCVSGAIGILLAYTGFGVWALVGQQLSSKFLNAVLYWIYNKWIPKLMFSMQSFKEMWSFGWKIMVSGLLNTGWSELYQVVIGKVYSTATLGLYTRANQFASLIACNLTSIVQRVSYPVLSSIQDDTLRLKEIYRKIITSTMYISFGLMIGLVAVAKPMILVLLGEKWIESVVMLQIICFNLMLFPLQAINLNMLQVKNRSDLYLKLEIVKKIISIAPILIGIFISIYWMLICSVFTGIACYFVNSYYSGRLIGYSVKQQIIDIAPSFFVSLFMGIVVFSMSFIMNLHPILILSIQIIVGAALYICLSEFFHITPYHTIKQIVQEQLVRRK